MKQIFYIFEYLRFLMNKDATYWKSNEDICIALHQAQLSLFMERVGNPAKYQVGHPIPPQSYQVTKKISADLQPFVREVESVLVNGEFDLPDSFVYPTSLRKAKDGRDIEILDDDKIAQRFSSLVKPITPEFPVAEITGSGYRVYPNTLTKYYLKYLKLPLKPKYVTTLEGDDEVYDDVNSVDLEWGEIAVNEIVNRALAILGLNVKDTQIQQFANYQKQQGS